MSDLSVAGAPPEAHPLVAQLSALHHFRVYTDIAIVVVVLALTNLLAHFTTPWANVAVVPAAAVGLLMLVRSRGLGWSEIGLGREHWRSGAGYALAAVTLVGTVIAVGALLPWTRPMFLNDHYATLSGALIASMIIIPLQTVIPEELAFRGVLHGALDRAWGFRGVAAAGSLLFGLWHIATSMGLTASNVGFTWEAGSSEWSPALSGPCWPPQQRVSCSPGCGVAAAVSSRRSRCIGRSTGWEHWPPPWCGICPEAVSTGALVPRSRARGPTESVRRHRRSARHLDHRVRRRRGRVGTSDC